MSNTPMLDTYAVNLTKKYQETSEFSPILSRDIETREVAAILSQKFKNNAILVGEAGVGKTAIVEGIAQALAVNRVPKSLKGKEVWELDLAKLSDRNTEDGGLQVRVKKLIDEIIGQKGKIILFVDETHLILDQNSGTDLSNILKPALARGELRMIGSTTDWEFHKYIEKDKALVRRFQRVTIQELDRDPTVQILKSRKIALEVYHGVSITEEAIESIADLSIRYLPTRRNPDKSIDILDKACALTRIEIDDSPTDLKLLQGKIASIEKDIELEDDLVKKEFLKKQLDLIKPEYELINKEWLSQKNHLDKITKIRSYKLDLTKKLLVEESKDLPNPDIIAQINVELEKCSNILDKQKDSFYSIPNLLISDIVDKSKVLETIQLITGIPISDLSQNEIERLKRIESDLHKRVIGQDHAIKQTAYSIKRSRLGFNNPKKPIGSFLFLGPSGVGKTELAKTLAEIMFGDEKKMKRLDCGQLKSVESLSRLIGAPPGTDDIDSGGELTEYVKKNPYSLLLLDEAEKAHPSIFDLFLSILDDGEIADSRGDIVNFKNTIIILTSNLGQRQILAGRDPKTGLLYPEVEEQVKAIIKNPDVDRGGVGFKPEFVGRLSSIVIFFQLSREELEKIANLKLKQLKKRMFESRNIRLVFGKKIPQKLRDSEGPVLDVAWWLSQQVPYNDLVLGGRPIEQLIESEIENRLTDLLLEESVPDGSFISIEATYPIDKDTYIDEKGNIRPVKPFIKISVIEESLYYQLNQFDPTNLF